MGGYYGRSLSASIAATGEPLDTSMVVALARIATATDPALLRDTRRALLALAAAMERRAVRLEGDDSAAS